MCQIARFARMCLFQRLARPARTQYRHLAQLSAQPFGVSEVVIIRTTFRISDLLVLARGAGAVRGGLDRLSRVLPSMPGRPVAAGGQLPRGCHAKSANSLFRRAS